MTSTPDAHAGSPRSQPCPVPSTPTEAPPTAEQAPLVGRVLVAEDNADVRRLIVTLLRESGHEVTAVEHGSLAVAEAWRAVQEQRPFDLILMDIQMPVLDGVVATRQLRSEGYRGVIVALSAQALESDRQRGLEAGCDEYLVKPINRELLLAVVRAFVVLGR